MSYYDYYKLVCRCVINILKGGFSDDFSDDFDI